MLIKHPLTRLIRRSWTSGLFPGFFTHTSHSFDSTVIVSISFFRMFENLACMCATSVLHKPRKEWPSV